MMFLSDWIMEALGRKTVRENGRKRKQEVGDRKSACDIYILQHLMKLDY